MGLLVRKWLELCYSSMMFKEKKEIPKNWIGRIAFLINFKIFFILSAVVFNIIIGVLGIGDYNKLILILIGGGLAYFSFILNDKNVRKCIIRHELPKKYVNTSDAVKFVHLIIVISVSFSTFVLFIYSFKIQSYF